MSAHAIAKARGRKALTPVFTWPFACLVLAVAAAAAFISDVLWPSWPSAPIALDAPPMPIMVAGALFEIPPAAIREAVQRHPGQHERIDLVFSWPALTPAAKARLRENAPLSPENALAAASQAENERLFVTIAALAGVLPPLERLRTIYPRYLAGQPGSGPDGLALLSFRAGTPYQGEDLFYGLDNPEQFFARCTRQAGAVAGSCISERALDGTQISMRFPRDWLNDWRNVAAGFDRLVTQLHPAKW
jgi:hypothetical protein